MKFGGENIPIHPSVFADLHFQVIGLSFAIAFTSGRMLTTVLDHILPAMQMVAKMMRSDTQIERLVDTLFVLSAAVSETSAKCMVEAPIELVTAPDTS